MVKFEANKIISDCLDKNLKVAHGKLQTEEKNILINPDISPASSNPQTLNLLKHVLKL